MGNINNKKIISYLLINIIASLFILHAQLNYSYHPPVPGMIPIVAITPIPENQQPSYQAYKQVQDCGFNIVGVAGSVDFIKKQIDITKDLNLKFWTHVSGINSEKCKYLINELRGEEKIVCWNLYDEPKFDILPQVKENYDRVWINDDTRLVFVNLIGEQQKIFTGTTKNYPDYLNYIQNLLHPCVWSYDCYPLSLKRGKLYVSYDLFYSDLEAFLTISRKTERPFYAFCQGMGFKNYAVQRPNPQEEYLRFEAFSALAYGAQGIIYWTYGLRNSTQYETYISALVDLKGDKTKYWDGAKKVNNEIKKYNDVFYGCNVSDVRHTGNTLYKDTKKLTGDFGPFTKISTGDKGVMASLIKNQDKNYIVIVSHDVEHSQKITLYPKNRKSLRELTSLAGSFINSDSPIQITLPKGGYIIFSY